MKRLLLCLTAALTLSACGASSVGTDVRRIDLGNGETITCIVAAPKNSSYSAAAISCDWSAAS